MKKKQKEKGNGFRFGGTDGNNVAKSVTTNAGSRMDDNFIKCVQVGQLYGTEIEPNPQAGRIYDSNGLSPTMDTCCGGNRMPKILEEPFIVASRRKKFRKSKFKKIRRTNRTKTRTKYKWNNKYNNNNTKG